MFKRALSFIASLAVTIASADLSTNSTMFFYEPKKPNKSNIKES